MFTSKRWTDIFYSREDKKNFVFLHPPLKEEAYTHIVVKFAEKESSDTL